MHGIRPAYHGTKAATMMAIPITRPLNKITGRSPYLSTANPALGTNSAEAAMIAVNSTPICALLIANAVIKNGESDPMPCCNTDAPACATVITASIT